MKGDRMLLGRWIRALMPLCVLLVPACALPWKTTPTTPRIDKQVSALPTTPVPAGSEFAAERHLGVGSRIALHKMPSVGPEGLDQEEPSESYSPYVFGGPTTLPPSDVDKDPAVVKAMRSYLQGHPNNAIDQLRSLTPANQELLLQLIPAVAKLANENVNKLDPQESSLIAAQLQGVAKVIARNAPLQIEKTVFCRSVKNFGHYDPLPPNAPFQPGEIHILYVELGNVPCLPSSQNGVEGYLIRMNCSLQLRDMNDRPLELTSTTGKSTNALVETKADFSRSPLRDYFMLFWFAAPTKPGKYLVNFKVHDPVSGREISKSVPFWVAGQ